MTRTPFGIAGTGSCVPDKVVTNDDLSHMVDTSDEWITQRTGIKERRVCSEGETTSDLCIKAAERALANANMDAADLDAILVASVTPDRQIPAMACKIQHAIGARKVAAFDMMAACSGFVFATNVAAQYLWNGTHRNVLVIGAEALSRVVDYSDRTSCIIFGDGAGAAVYSADAKRGRVRSTSLYSDGEGYEVMTQKAGGAETAITPEVIAAMDHKLHIRGREVYKFAVNRMVELVRGEIEANPQLEFGGIVPHQVNMRIIESARDKLELDEDQVFVNIDKYGNTSAGSIPIALDEANRTGFLDSMEGKLVVMCAFGAGLTWGSVGLEW